MAILYTVYLLVRENIIVQEQEPSITDCLQYHCLPMFQFEVPPEYRDRGAIAIGALHFFVGEVPVDKRRRRT